MIAHSDGDVALHALCDALLGAMALGDIGEHFPDSDPRWKGADSRRFLRHCGALVQEQGWRVVNADLTILAQVPRIGPHRLHMRQNIADDLGVRIDCINVKATTTEELGALGRGEGLACQAIVLLAYGDNAHQTRTRRAVERSGRRCRPRRCAVCARPASCHGRDPSRA